MAQPLQLNIHYPFGNPNKQTAQDAQSYHSITIDQKKLSYFDQQIDKSLPRMSQTNLKRKNPLPPSYPYEQVKKLKQSLKLQNKSKSIPDNHSISSMDSFHTANEFQSICYEEGDFQKIIQQMQHSNPFSEQIVSNNNMQNDTCNKENYPSVTSFKSIKHEQQQRPHKIGHVTLQSNTPMQQSEALKDFDIEDLQEGQNSGQKYEGFDEKDQIQQNQKHLNSQAQQNHDEVEKQIQISHIQNALNESQLMDHEILQLTRQIQNIHSSQEQLLQQNKISEQCIQKQQVLAQRYSSIESRLKQFHSTQKNFTSQIVHMHQLMKKTQNNNSYLQKELQFFKQKSQLLQEKQKTIQQKQQLKNKQLNTSKSHSLSLIQQKTKPKTYNIKPKAPNNQSFQSRKYKELTFQYCFGNQDLKSEDKWHDLEIDNQNNPPEYKLIYSFQHQNTILAVRLVDLVSNESSRSSLSSKKSSGQGVSIRKNYQYLIDFAHKKYESQEQKLQSLSKELVVNINQEKYVSKEFTKKIEVFLMICEEQTYIDLVKLIPLPNPLVFYIESRFNFVGKTDKDLSKVSANKDGQNMQNQNQQGDKEKQGKQMGLSNSLRKLQNLSKFMKTYIIKIEHMADIQSIQKLMSLKWINTGSTQQARYFTVKTQWNQKAVQKSNQLFFVKIQDCMLQTGPEYDCLDQKHKYSLTFQVGSNSDNDLLVDLIEFLTFLTVC